MAIRDRFRRAVHKAPSSGSISPAESNTTLNTTTTVASSETSSTTASSSLRRYNSTMFGRTFTWGRNEKDPIKEKEKDMEKQMEKEKKRKEKAAKSKKPMHPRDKPLTATNLRHQEMLSHFTMTFGSEYDHAARLSFAGGVSPCCTRPASIIDGDDELDPITPQSGRSLPPAEPPKASSNLLGVESA